ncbi:MAG: nitroreductase family protein [Acidobacteriota bacterium]|jgi:nitroreductase|nr:nitroreductase family protein [Acidobacteriota bacterium]
MKNRDFLDAVLLSKTTDEALGTLKEKFANDLPADLPADSDAAIKVLQNKYGQEFLDVLTARKSIRRYKPDPVPDEMIDKILEAARWAPTGENYQPWRFIVVRDQETRNKIGDLALEGSGSRMTSWYCLNELQKRFEGIEDPVKRAGVLEFMYSGKVSEFAKQAPVVIAVIGDLRVGSVDVPYDCCAALDSMTLQAHAMGLGSCWVYGPVASTRDAIRFKELLGIPTAMGYYKVVSYLAVGYPLEQRRHPRPKVPLEDMVFWEKFGNKERK